MSGSEPRWTATTWASRCRPGHSRLAVPHRKLVEARRVATVRQIDRCVLDVASALTKHLRHRFEDLERLFGVSEIHKKHAGFGRVHVCCSLECRGVFGGRRAARLDAISIREMRDPLSAAKIG